MFKWSQVLKRSPIDWLLETKNPSVRYFTLRYILGNNENEREVIAAKQCIPECRVLKRILAKQNPKGYWEHPANPYHPKYKSSYWQIMLLGQLGMDRTNRKIERACEHIFQFQLEEGGFASETQETALREYEWKLKKGEEVACTK